MPQVQTRPFNREEMLERLGGDSELMDDVLQVFLEECPRMLNEARCAVEGGDPKTVRRAAHSIKGALLNISAAPAAAEAIQLEELGDQDRLGECGPVLERLQHELERLQQALTEQTTG
jgi:two-component system sensor histidine kinase/response regulator